MNKIQQKQQVQSVWRLPFMGPIVAMGLVVALQLGQPHSVKAADLSLQPMQSEEQSSEGQTNMQPAAVNALYIPAVQNKGDRSQPTVTPSVTVVPTEEPTEEPTSQPTEEPTEEPTETPTTTPTTTPTATPTPERLGAGVVLDEQWKVASSALAVDAEGGMHLAYVYYEPQHRPDPDDDNPTAAVYSYCQAHCDSKRNWQMVMLGDQVSEVQIGLTPLGQPRLLLLVRAEAAWGKADQYLYAECDENCTKLAGWQVGAVIMSANNLSWNPDPDFLNRDDEPKRSFALDPQGRPRFVHYHYNAEHALGTIGAYYAACDAHCTESASWTHTRITQVYEQFGTWYWEELYDPALAFTSTGHPRLGGSTQDDGHFANLWH